MITVMIISVLLIVASALPFIKIQHWIFRAAEFIKLQLLLLQAIIFAITFFFIKENPGLWYLQAVQFALIVYHFTILAHYSKFWRSNKSYDHRHKSDKIKLISCNVYQYNKEYHRFITLIKEELPDIFFTMESNEDWERAMRVLEKDYPNFKKVTLENTYGMHFYTRLKLKSPVKIHYFVADDLPSMEVELQTKDGHSFVLFCIHPPPPSPTEEDNSKERDGDLVSLAKMVRLYKKPVLVNGDFNNVAWAESSRLFKKVSGLIDARVGRGILATFNAKFWFFRIPLDLLFHSPDIFVNELKTYPSVGSDHFPIGCTIQIYECLDKTEASKAHLDQEDKERIEEMIDKGKNEKSDNRND